MIVLPNLEGMVNIDVLLPLMRRKKSLLVILNQNSEVESDVVGLVNKKPF
jgi:hypothetical protein